MLNKYLSEIIQLLKVEKSVDSHSALVATISPAGLIFSRFETRKSELLLTDFGYEPLSQDVFENQLIIKPDKVLHSMKRLLENFPNNITSVVTCVPSYHVRFKKIKLRSTLTEREMYKQVKRAARKQFPDLKSAFYVDYYFEDATPKKSVNESAEPADQEKKAIHREEIDVNILACSSEIVDTYLSIFSDLGMQLAILDVDLYATFRAMSLLKNDSASIGFGEKVISLLEFDYNKLSLAVIAKDKLIYQNVEPYENQFWSEDENSTQAKNTYATLFARIDRLLQFYYTKHPNYPISTFYIAGLGALLPDCLIQFKTKFGDMVKIINPVNQFKIADSVNSQQVQEKAPLLLPTIGMGMRTVIK